MIHVIKMAAVDVGTTNTVLVTVPDTMSAVVSGIELHNVGAVSATVDLYYRVSVAGTLRRCGLPAGSAVSAGGMLSVDRRQTMGGGSQLVAVASVADVIQAQVNGALVE